MKGCKYFFGIEKVIFNKDNTSMKKLKLSKSMSSLFKNKSYFNGNILGCTDYTVFKNKLFLKYQKVRFFDFLTRRNKTKLPKLINVNAVIKISNAILLIKRKGNVFSYRNYWDFPAGFVFDKEKPLPKLLNRIKNDTNLTKRHLSKGKLLGFGSSNWYFPLFYIFELEISKKRLCNLIGNKEIIILKTDNIKIFLKKNKVVFPEALAHFAT